MDVFQHQSQTAPNGQNGSGIASSVDRTPFGGNKTLMHIDRRLALIATRPVKRLVIGGMGAAVLLLMGCGNSVSIPLGPGGTYGGAGVQTYSVVGSPGVYLRTAPGTTFTTNSDLIVYQPIAALPSGAVKMCTGSQGDTVYWTGDGWGGAEIICEIVPGGSSTMVLPTNPPLPPVPT